MPDPVDHYKILGPKAQAIHGGKATWHKPHGKRPGNDHEVAIQLAYPRVMVRVQEDASGCWVWPGGKNSNGYGRIQVNANRSYVNLYVHRVVFESTVGPIPEGLQLDHLCKNRACCNPADLEAVDQRTNLLRGEGFSAINARKTHCPSNHPYEGSNLIVQADGSRKCRICKRAKDARRRDALR